MTPDPAPTDPVLVRRAAIARWCGLGKRLGYALYGAAVVLFFVGLATGYDGGIATAITTCLVVGAVVLVPAIVFGYGVRAAAREDAESGPAVTGR